LSINLKEAHEKKIFYQNVHLNFLQVKTFETEPEIDKKQAFGDNIIHIVPVFHPCTLQSNLYEENKPIRICYCTEYFKLIKKPTF